MINIWHHYAVRWRFITSLCASVPANPEIVRTWLESREPTARPPQGRSIAEIQEEVFATIATEEEPEASKSLLVFQRIDNQLVVRSSTVRSHIKDCARQISVYFVGKLKGEKAFSTRVLNCVYYDETKYWLPIVREDGTPFSDADGRRDKAIHTWQGNALKTIEFVNGANLDFTLKVLGGKVSQEDLETIFTYGGTHGYGGERGDGEGRYTFTIKPIGEEADNGKRE